MFFIRVMTMAKILTLKIAIFLLNSTERNDNFRGQLLLQRITHDP